MVTKIPTVSILKDLLKEGGKIEDIAKTAKQRLDKRGQKTNSAGKQITEANLQRLAKAMLRDISNERKGWWSTFEISEEQDQVKITEKK